MSTSFEFGKFGAFWVPVLAIVFGGATLVQAEVVNFEKVAVLLEKRCLGCHRRNMNEGGLVMETRADLVKGGDSGAAIVSGDRAGSELFRRICLSKDDSERMPPEGEGEVLGVKDLELIGRWIDAGAPWPEGRKLKVAPNKQFPAWDTSEDPEMAEVEILPKKIVMSLHDAPLHVRARVRMRNGSTHDITHAAKWSVDDPTLVRLEGTGLRTLKVGSSILRLQYRGMVAKLDVCVRDSEKQSP